MIDFHSHVLPGIDDGSSSTEESLAMLEMLAAQGITRVVATPHFYPRHDRPETFLARRAEAEYRLRTAMSQREGLPKLSLGAEVFFFGGMSQSDSIPELAFDGKKCILVEMPDGNWTESMYKELKNIYKYHGIVPVIAHVERYIGSFRMRNLPERLEKLPVLVQSNADFFLNPKTRRKALRMLDKGQIQLLGSDCHNISQRPPRMGEATEIIRNALGQGCLDGICAQACELLD